MQQEKILRSGAAYSQGQYKATSSRMCNSLDDSLHPSDECADLVPAQRNKFTACADMAEAQTSEHIQSHPIMDDWIEAEEAEIPASDNQLADDQTTYKTDPDSGPIGSTGGHSVA